MNETKELLRRGGEGFAPREGIMDSLIRRRDRKRRNQRIAAGVVGIAVFVAAVWIVTSVSSLDRSETSVGPAGDVTGPVETGPAETGPTVHETAEPNSYRIPPAGTPVSTPVEGELIAESNYHYPTLVRVYADGRVLSWYLGNGPPCWESECLGGPPFVEHRLSPEGVELVRSGAVRPKDVLSIPENAWVDREGKPYVPARYGACFWRVDIPLDVEALLDLLPASAQALLRGSNPAWNPRCLVVTAEEARSLEEIMASSRRRGGSPVEVGAWSLRDGNGDLVEIFLSLRPLFPDGRRLFMPGF